MSAHLIKIDATPDLVERVYQTLLDAICDGSLPPGARLTQEDIAAQLAVSRQPVLQALRLLKKDGFVQDAPPGGSGATRGRGVQVASLDPEWIGKIYQVRGALDALAARLAAEQHYRIDPALIDNGRKVARGRDIKAMIDADMAFHNAIYAASGNPLIEQSAHQHWRHLRRVMGAVLQSSRQRESVWDEHEAIAHAIAHGKVEQAVQLIEQHGQQASRDLGIRLQRFITTTGDHP